ncbi:MAG TPA: carboxyltransferase domain-containing protein, partial [Dermatophilaceae bacterium]|nr:carboxyltransferase domain-containing protein [Dermatophilaceae bacterium]
MASETEPGLVRVLPCGERALLVEVADTLTAVALARQFDHLRAAGGPPWSDVHDVVTGERTVLVIAWRLTTVIELRPAILESVTAARLPVLKLGSELGTGGNRTPAIVVPLEIPVVYDGPDLLDVAA